MDGSVPPGIRVRPCPVCRNPAMPEFRPFCSKRCADVDLNRWLVGRYAIPTDQADDDESQPPVRNPESE